MVKLYRLTSERRVIREVSPKKPSPAANNPNCRNDRRDMKEFDSGSVELAGREEVLGGSLIVPWCRNAIRIGSFQALKIVN